MNARYRLPITIMVSLLFHIALLKWFLLQTQVRPLHHQAIFQVSLSSYAQIHRQLLPPVATASSVIRNAKSKQEPKQQPILQRPAPTPAKANLAQINIKQSTSRFRWLPPPSNQQNDVINAMRHAQLAHQRESHAAAVFAELSNLSVQLRHALTGKIVCVQQSDHAIDCTPEPDDKMSPLLEQFLNLALEARRIGIGENPMRMDFGPELGVSVTLLP